MGFWDSKAVIVTGASKGIGLAIARSFASRGASVLMVARGSVDLESAAETLREEGGKVATLSVDVTLDTAPSSVIDRCIEEFGQIDCLVNNAGRSMRAAVMDTTEADFRELMELNFFALMRFSQAAMPHLLSRKGHLVNVSSLAGKTAARYMGAYPASKFAVTGYSQQLRLELGPEGLHVMTVCPGPVDTGLMDGALTGHNIDDLPDRVKKPGAGARTRVVPAAEVAEAIVTGCERRQKELLFPWWGRFVLSLQQLSPNLSDFLVRTFS